MELLGCLNYLATWTRPDLTFAVSAMSSFMVKNNKAHWELLRGILRYLVYTKDRHIQLGREKNTKYVHTVMQIGLEKLRTKGQEVVFWLC